MTNALNDIDDEFWEDGFHTMAFWAYCHQAAAEAGQPDPEKTRQRAYRYFG